jgi:hypothetical protein
MEASRALFSAALSSAQATPRASDAIPKLLSSH